jgi:hypothetical protein
MDTETVLAQILPKVSAMLKVLVEQMAEQAQPTLYTLEEQTQALLPRIGQMVLQEVVGAQGSGLRGPERACACGGRQVYHDRRRPLSVMSSLGRIRLDQRAYYACAGCGAHALPLDEQLGLGRAGRMSRYLQEQCGWLLALLPAQTARQTLTRFGWPAVATSQVREHGEALGAELERREQAQRVTAQTEAGRPPAQQGVPRQPPESDRLYAAPDGVMYCTTMRDAVSGQAVWRELKVAAVYESQPARLPAASANAERDASPSPSDRHWSARERIVAYLHTHAPPGPVAPADQAVHVTYVAETGPWQDFGVRLWSELWARGLGRPVRDLAVVADGSEHIDQVVDRELRLPEVQLTRILDLAHAQEHLWDVAKARWGESSPQAATWVQPLLLALEQGQVEQVVTTLAALVDSVDSVESADSREASAPEALTAPSALTHTRSTRVARQAAAYFAQRRAQVAYPQFVAAGYQIGSGLAESTCKRFGTDRMKGAGMRWTVPGAQTVATLRMLLLSDRWQEVADYCRTAA